MKRLSLTLLALLFAFPFLAALPAYANGGAPSGGAKRQASTSTRPRKKESSKKQFMRQTGFPKGRKGYVVDYIVPRSKGGMDHPANMQWLRKADAKAKHKRERARR